jgi:hypothetical protein
MARNFRSKALLGILLSCAHSNPALAVEWGDMPQLGSLSRALQDDQICMATGSLLKDPIQDPRSPGFLVVTLTDRKAVHCPRGTPTKWLLAAGSFRTDSPVLIVGFAEQNGDVYAPAVFTIPEDLEGTLSMIRRKEIESLLASVDFSARTSGLTMLADLRPSLCPQLLDAYLFNNAVGSPSEVVRISEAVLSCPTSAGLERLTSEMARAETMLVAAQVYRVLNSLRPYSWSSIVRLMQEKNSVLRAVAFASATSFPEARVDEAWLTLASQELDPVARSVALTALRELGIRNTLRDAMLSGDQQAQLELVRLDGIWEGSSGEVDEQLLAALANSRRDIRSAAYESVHLILTRESRPVLETRVLQTAESDPGVRYLQVLAASSAKTVVPRRAFLAMAAQEPNPEFYSSALRAAFEISQECGPEATETLTSIAQHHSTQPSVALFMDLMDFLWVTGGEARA